MIMKRIIIISCMLVSAINIMAQAKLSSKDRDKYISHVKQYCELLKDFSGNIDNVILIDSIIAKCENNKVQTFDDLTLKHSKTDIEINSLPLFQYLQNVTTKYDNELDVSFSDFKCEKTISEPTAMGDIPFSSSYAIVHVNKRIKGKGINVSVPLKITINTSSLKVGGTVSEVYEDPHSLYLHGLELFQDGKTAASRAYFEKCSHYRSYSGRFRALTLLGVSYVNEKKWSEAIECLTRASENDPVGGVMLAMFLCQDETPLELRNGTKAVALLEKYANNRDKDYPMMQPLANASLGALYLQGRVMPVDKEKAYDYLEKARNDVSIQNNYNFIGYVDMIRLVLISDDNPQNAIRLLPGIESYLSFVETPIKEKLGEIVYSFKVLIYRSLNKFDIAMDAAENLKKFNKAKSYHQIAEIYKQTNKFDEAIKNYELAALLGEPESCHILFLYYYPFDKSQYDESQFDDFSRFAMPMHSKKNKIAAINYLKKAADNGHLVSMENLAMMYLVPDYGIQNYSEGIKWALLRADNGSYDDSSTNRLFSIVFSEIMANKHYELVDIIESYTDKSMSSNALLNGIYATKDYPKADSIKAYIYLKKGSEMGSFMCQADMAWEYLVQKKDTAMCEQICMQMIQRRHPYGFILLGDICRNRGSYDKALNYYQQAYNMNYCAGAFGLGELYLDGLGVPQDIDKAIEYANIGLEIAKAEGREDRVVECQKLLDRCNEALSHGYVASSEVQSSPCPGADELNQILNPNLSADKRIALSEKWLKKYFASQKAIVKTVGSNATTIVSTETAEDFMLRIGTSSNIAHLTILQCNTDEQGKILELIIQEVR